MFTLEELIKENEKAKENLLKNKNYLKKILKEDLKIENKVNLKFNEFKKNLRCSKCEKIVKDFFRINDKIILCKSCYNNLKTCQNCIYNLDNKCYLKINKSRVYNHNKESLFLCFLKVNRRIFYNYTLRPKKQYIKSRYFLKNKLRSKYL